MHFVTLQCSTPQLRQLINTHTAPENTNLGTFSDNQPSVYPLPPLGGRGILSAKTILYGTKDTLKGHITAFLLEHKYLWNKMYLALSLFYTCEKIIKLLVCFLHLLLNVTTTFCTCILCNFCKKKDHLKESAVHDTSRKRDGVFWPTFQELSLSR